MAEADLAAVHRGAGEHPGTRRRDPGKQPPVVLRLLLHAGPGASAGYLSGQGRVLHHRRYQGLVLPGVLLRHRPGADRPRRHRRRSWRADRRHPDPRSAGQLLGIYPEGTRSPDGRLYKGKTGVARMALGGRRSGHSGGDDRHREDHADRPAAATSATPAGRPVRQAAGLLPVRGPGRRPVRRAVDDRRDHVRADAAVRAGIRRHLRREGQAADRRATRLREPGRFVGMDNQGHPDAVGRTSHDRPLPVERAG